MMMNADSSRWVAVTVTLMALLTIITLGLLSLSPIAVSSAKRASDKELRHSNA